MATHLFSTNRRIALALGLPFSERGIDLVKGWRERTARGISPLPPRLVEEVPLKENLHTGAEVDLYEFPAPRWHELDGGRYIGTADAVIVRDPDTGWVNLGTHRVQIHSKSKASIFTSPGKHFEIIRQKYWERGQNCPAAVVCGQEPYLFMVAGMQQPWGVSEYDSAGGLRGEPVAVTRGVTTDLPLPATAEIVLEGEILPPEVETVKEGPFGEALGYYASGSRIESAFVVKVVLHRDNPIIQGAPPSLKLPVWTLGNHIWRAAELWNLLDREIPGVKGVWIMSHEGGASSTVVVSLAQQYAGHARQAAMLVSGLRISAYLLRWIIIVDEDIDPSSTSEVLWAMATRCEPENALDIVQGCWSSLLDPLIPPLRKNRNDLYRSQAIVFACKPYSWIKDFPPDIRPSPQLLQKIKEKWQSQF